MTPVAARLPLENLLAGSASREPAYSLSSPGEELGSAVPAPGTAG